MRIRALAAVAALAVALTACGNSGDDEPESSDTTAASEGPGETTAEDLDTNVPVDAPGVTDTEINVGVISSKSNPINGKYAQIADGINAYFAMVNSEGGIYGRELKVAKERDDISGLQNLQQVQESLATDNLFATFLATLGFAGADALDQAGMPTFIWNIRPEMAGHPNIFANSGALCFGCTGQIVPWLAEQLGAEQVGILGYGVANESKLCAQGLRDSFDQYPTAELVFYDDTLQFAAPDLSSQVAQMKDKGVDFITTCMDINETIVLAKEMQKQGLDAVQQLPNGYDHELVRANAELLEGSIVIPQFVALEHEPQIDEVQTYLEWMDEIGKEPVEVASIGWVLAAQFVEGLKLAGPEFSQAKLIDALNTQDDVRVNGMIPPIDWTKQHEDPRDNPDAEGDLECANFVKVVGGEFEPAFSEPGKPWVCFENNAPGPELALLGNRSFVPGEDEDAASGG